MTVIKAILKILATVALYAYISHSYVCSRCNSFVGRSHMRLYSRSNGIDKEGLKTGRIQITDPFQSPSLIRTTRPVADLTNAYESPSIQVNGLESNTSVNPLLSPSCIVLIRAGTKTVDALKSPSVIFLGIDEAKIRNAMKSPSLIIAPKGKTIDDLPLSLVTGQETIKNALKVLAINPKIGGLSIVGSRGTAKTVMAKAFHRFMPSIKIIKDSQYNIAPDATGFDMDDILRMRLRSDNISRSDLAVETIECPFVQVPINILEDRLFGALDVKKTLESGQTVFTPGLLASAHRGVLFVDNINLIDTDIVFSMLQAVNDGFVLVEREGISMRYPCRPLLVTAYNPEDAELKTILQDRIGMCLSTNVELLSIEDRTAAVNKV
mmetsp:Transcript_13812/g.13878  ORF Transcript_13812/g.13878 Transcript_13812/m.13878 type:complete len:380 (+) Transcript_13812:52-1191(+)